MKALFWKRIKEFEKSKRRIIVFFLFPVIYLTLLVVTGASWNNIVSFYPLSVTLLSIMSHFSLEELLSCEVFLSTGISIKKLWLSNSLFITVLGYLYSVALLILGSILYSIFGFTLGIDVYSVLLLVIGPFVCISLICGSTIHFADYSKHKQIIASVFAIFCLAIPLALLFMINIIIPDLQFLLFLILASVLLFLLSYLLMTFEDKEKLLLNTQLMVKAYQNKTIEE